MGTDSGASARCGQPMRDKSTMAKQQFLELTSWHQRRHSGALDGGRFYIALLYNVFHSPVFRRHKG
jgi:hypothetical protein